MKASDVKGVYKPTKAEAARVTRKKGFFTLSGDGVFHTIQGEGNRIGRPITFVRLHFCNLACSWCDTPYAWCKEMKEFWTEPTQLAVGDLYSAIIAAQVEKGVTTAVERVCFTGGEPLIHQHEIIQFMKENPEFEVEIETNGTILPEKFLLDQAYFNCSPKLTCSGNKDLRTYNEDAIEAISQSEEPCFKFVCQTAEDIHEVLKNYSSIPREQIYIMPEGVTKEENTAVYEKIAATIISEGLCSTPRLQNIMFDGAKRRV